MRWYLRQQWVNILLGISILCSINAHLIHAQTPTPNELKEADTSVSAETNFNQGNITLAIQQWGREIREGKNVAKALYNRSQAYILLNQYEFAIKDLDQLLAIQGNQAPAEVYIVRGIALTEIAQLSDAIESFNQAERIQASPLVYNNRAIAYQRQGQLNQALEDLQKSMQIAPIPTHQLNLANLQIQLGHYHQAIMGMNQLLAQHAQFFPAYITRGIAYYNLGEFEIATRNCLLALQVQPDQADAYYYAGLSLAALNHKAEASQNLVRAANLYLQSNQAQLYHQVLEKMTELDLQ